MGEKLRLRPLHTVSQCSPWKLVYTLNMPVGSMGCRNCYRKRYINISANQESGHSTNEKRHRNRLCLQMHCIVSLSVYLFLARCWHEVLNSWVICHLSGDMLGILCLSLPHELAINSYCTIQPKPHASYQLLTANSCDVLAVTLHG